jgi:glucosamine--fructose-6-phosphate aminotransferase (isomerizing)
MCGIIGYIGPKDVVPLLIDGLRRLEYRGYDSAGIAVMCGGEIRLRRAAGKLSSLEAVVGNDPLSGVYGVGHTRWATHGRPTEQNAHPHRDCTGRIVVVHNGIIENYLDLKRDLVALGHRFVTETDTEIVAHLVEREMRDDGLEGAVRRALQVVKGLFALVLISADDPGKIVAVRNGPPIVVGLGDEEFFVASDVPAILTHTRDAVFLGNEEMAVITPSGVRFTDFYGRHVAAPVQRVLWEPGTAEKGGFRHFMLKEIFEQPTAARDTIAGRVLPETSSVDIEEIGIRGRTLAALEKVTILACGTSWHAGLVGKFMIERLARVPVEVDYGSEYRYRGPIADERTLAVAVTQSGETADTLAALREARRLGAVTLAVCNAVGSMATREAHGTIYTHAGPEIGVASTKAFTTQLVALYLLALRLAQARGVLTPEASAAHVDAVRQLPGRLEQTLLQAEHIQEIAARFHTRRNFLYLGRNAHYPIALEGALKLKEVSYIHAEGYPAGEMKHGPIALIDETMPTVVLAPNDHVFDKMLGNVQEVKARGGPVIALATRGDGRLADTLDLSKDALIEVPATDELITPILMTVPLQLFAYHVAVLRGCDVDQPRNLAKSVTVE